MSVIVRGMKMPGRCGNCPCFNAENPIHCQAVKADKAKRIAAPYGLPRPDWCHLVEVPPIYGKCVFDGTKAQSSEQLEALVAAVEAWIEANPIKTNAQQFEEVFGLSGHRLIDQNAQWWDEPYKEPEHDDRS